MKKKESKLLLEKKTHTKETLNEENTNPPRRGLCVFPIPCNVQALAVGLERPPDFLLSKHAKLMETGNESTLRLIYYPPLGTPEPGLTRCGPHCDYGTFTLLAQVGRTINSVYHV